MVMDDSSSEDLTEVESELEDTEEKGSEEACEEPVNNKTHMYEKDNYIPLVKGSYYLRQLEPNKKLLAVGKLIDTVTDTTVTFQHFRVNHSQISIYSAHGWMKRQSLQSYRELCKSPEPTRYVRPRKKGSFPRRRPPRI